MRRLLISGCMTAVVAVMALRLPGAAHAATYTTIDPPDSIYTGVSGINDVGAICGFYRLTSGAWHGFVRAPDGTYTTFFASGDTFALSINTAGAITGEYDNSAKHGFVRSPDRIITTFDVPGSIETHPLSINSAGAIVGRYLDGYGVPHGFVRAPDGTITTFDPPGSVGTRPTSINDGGAIVGSYSTTDFVSHGFLRAPDGTFTTFLPGISDIPTINAAGAIAGSYIGTDSAYHGFVRAPDGTITTFDPPASEYIVVFMINDGGVIVGTYMTSGFVPHGFVRAPDGTITTFDVPGAALVYGGGSGAAGINAGGAIAGNFWDGSTWHGFLRSPGLTLSLPSNITVDATSPQGALVTYTASASDQNGAVPVSCIPPSGSTFPIGTSTVTCTTTNQTDTESGTFQVLVQAAAAQITNLMSSVQNLNLQQGITNSLDAKLSNAEAALTAAKGGNVASTCNQLNAFINETQAQSGKALTVDQVNQLLTTANRIKAVIGCP